MLVQMNLFTKQKQTHRFREWTYGHLGEGCGEGRVRELGWTCTHYCIENGSPTRPCCGAQGTLLNAMQQPGWEGAWGRMDIVIRLYPTTIFFFLKRMVLWLIHVNVWQNPLQYCKVISLQLIKINLKKCNYTEKIKNKMHKYEKKIKRMLLRA